MIDPIEQYEKHIKSGLRYQRINRRILFFTVILSAIGSSSASIPFEWIKFIQAVIFIIIGALNTINNVMGLAARAEKHKIAASEYLIIAKLKEEGSDYVGHMTNILRTAPLPSP